MYVSEMEDDQVTPTVLGKRPRDVLSVTVEPPEDGNNGKIMLSTVT
jgi:hypothetical protein